MKKFKYIGCASSASVMWGLLCVFWNQFTIPATLLTAIRMIAANLTLILMIKPLHISSQMKEIVRKPKILVWIIIAGYANLCNISMAVWAAMNGRLLDSSLGYFISPLLISIIGGLMFREKIGRMKVLAVVIIILGVAVSTLYFGGFPLTSVIIAIPFTVYSLIKKKLALGGLASVAVETVSYIPVIIGYFIYTVFISHPGIIIGLNGKEYIFMLFSGIATLFPSMLYGIGVKELPVSMVGFLQYIAPTISAAIGVILYGEAMTNSRIASFVIIWIGIGIFLLSELNFQKREREIPMKGEIQI